MLPPTGPAATLMPVADAGFARAAASVPARVWLGFAFALLALALGAAVLVHEDALDQLEQAVRHDNAQLAEQVDRSHGELTGAMVVQGLLAQGLKDVLAGRQAPDAAL